MLPAGFGIVTDVAVGLDGSLYVADPGNARVRRIRPNGRVSTVAGGGMSTADGVPATQAALGNPRRVAVGADGSVYISDGARIRRVGPDGIITTVGGTGLVGTGGDDDLAILATIGNAAGVAVAPDGAIFIADPTHHRVRRVRHKFPNLTLGDVIISSEDGSEFYVFDASGRHDRTVDSHTLGLIYGFEYDDDGRLVSVSDGSGLTTTFERDGVGRLESITAPGAQQTAVTLHPSRYLATLTNPADETYEFTYDDGLLLTLTDPRDYVHTFTYDDLGFLEQDDDPAGGSQTLVREYLENGHEVTRTTELDRVSEYAVSVEPDGETLVTYTEPDGTQTEHAIALDETRVTTSPDGTETAVALGPDPLFGMMAPVAEHVTITTPGALVFESTETRAATTSGPGGVLALTQLTTTHEVNGRDYVQVVDRVAKTITDTTPAGRTRIRTVDALKRVILDRLVNPDLMPDLIPVLAPTAMTYTPDGRVETISTTGLNAANVSETRTITLGYDPQKRLETITDPLLRVTELDYDAADRVITATLPGTVSRAVEFAYADGGGNLTGITPPGRTEHTFAYTALNQEASYTPPVVLGGGTLSTEQTWDLDRALERIDRLDDTSIELAHDPTTGRLNQIVTPTHTITRAYYGPGETDPGESPGELKSVATNDGVTLSLGYDGTLLTTSTWAVDAPGGAIETTVTRGYDDDFRLASVAVEGTPAVAFTYDDDGLLRWAGALELTRHPHHGLVTKADLVLGPTQKVADTRTYTGFGELRTYTATANGAPIYTEDIALRDVLGRITAVTETVDDGINPARVMSRTYEYDPEGRLWKVDGGAITYGYDANGNRTERLDNDVPTVAAEYDAQDRLTELNATVYTYTANGELETKATPSDDVTRFTYDVFGNLRRVVLLEDDPTETVVEYLIDGQNHRVGRVVDGVVTHRYVWEDDLRVSAVLDAAGTVRARYVYGTRVNVPDYMVTATGTYRLLTDHLGSVRVVVDVATGAIVQERAYDEWGRVTVVSDRFVANDLGELQPFGFAGGLYDPMTTLVRFGARDYDAGVGRWTTKDPLGFSGDDLNLYAYARLDPVNLVDANGLFSDPGGAFSAYTILAAADVAVLGSGAAAATSGAAVVAPVMAAAAAGLAVGSAVDYFIGDALSDALFGPLDPVAAGKGKYVKPENPNRRHGAEDRQKTGQRERNVGHPDGEEHGVALSDPIPVEVDGVGSRQANALCV